MLLEMLLYTFIIFSVIRVTRAAGGVSSRHQATGSMKKLFYFTTPVKEPFIFDSGAKSGCNACVCVCVCVCVSHQPVDDTLDGVKPFSDQRLRL